MRMDNNGLILLDKNPGLTSFESLNIIKKALSTGKVGHTGTLDKFASGLLVVLVGQALKLSSLLNFCDKEYEAQIRFGIETDTLDPEGKIIREAEAPAKESVEEALLGFRGEIQQSPPAYSAIHINGKRAHELSRQGKIPEMKKRPVTIKKLELISWEPPFASIRVVCTSGTYIRSLARDIALEAGSCAHLNALKRTRTGGFFLSNAFNPEATNDSAILRQLVMEAIQPISPGIFSSCGLPFTHIEDKCIEPIRHGQSLYGHLLKDIIDNIDAGSVAGGMFPVMGLFDKNSALIAMLKQKQGKWQYANVFRS